MYPYTQDQWALVFFVYSLLGWVWESCYVSAKRRQWVNRGFLHGPWLPIYGTGALVILLLTLPVQGRPALIFLLGMTGATILEYVTGAGMEGLFHVRYWDYSDKPLNVNGHICLTVSLAWGVFSLLLVKVLHPPVEDLILWLPPIVTEKLVLLLVILFAVDATLSVQKALDLKALLASLSATNQRLAAIEARLKTVAEQLEEEWAAAPEHPLIRRHQQARETRRTYLLRKLSERRDRTGVLLAGLERKAQHGLEQVSKRLGSRPEESERLRLEELRTFLYGVDGAIHKTRKEIYARRTRDFQRAVDLLYRNPSATSRHYASAFRLLAALNKGREQEENGTMHVGNTDRETKQ